MRILLTLGLMVAAIGLAPVSTQAQSTDYKALTERIEEARQTWDVPGLSIAIVQDGQIVYNQGFGRLEKTEKQKPNGESLFAIASISKAFTTASLAMLVDEGKISWSDKVVTHLPWFELYDPWVTQQMTIEDLLTHRSGLKTFSGDLLWHASTHTKEEVVRSARFLKPDYEFRAGYGYQNIMYIAAGLILEKVTGMEWADFVQQRILSPLGMNRTLTSASQIPGKKNVAYSHSGPEGQNIPIPYVNWDNMAPAGALISCTEDLTKWMTLQLNRGVYKGDTLFSAKQSRAMWTDHNPSSVSEFAEKTYPGQSFSGYGLGWSLKNYRGQKIVSHGGGYDAMISNLTLIPGKNAGFAILSNNVTILPHALHHMLMDFIIGGEGSDKNWSEFFLPFIQKRDAHEHQRVEGLYALRSDTPNHSLPLRDYAGTYGGPMYGDLGVTFENDTLKFQFLPTPLFSGWLEPMNYDHFILHWDQVHMLPIGTASFLIDRNGKTEEVKIQVPNPDFYFEELEFKRRKE